MNGNENDEGIISRFFSALVEKSNNKETSFKVSAIEIYKEMIRDLLPNETPDENTRPLFSTARNNDAVDPPPGVALRIREDPHFGICVSNASFAKVQSVRDVSALLEAASDRRHVGSTKLNDKSSRSHMVFTIFCQREQIFDQQGEVEVLPASNDSNLDLSNSTCPLLRTTLYSKAVFVDLAGSENARASDNVNRVKEGASINTSLLALGRVIEALGKATESCNDEPKEREAGKHDQKQKDRKGRRRPSSLGTAESCSRARECSERRTSLTPGAHPGQHATTPPPVPFRDSLLTSLLRDVLGGQARTAIIATIRPERIYLEESMRSLRFGTQAGRVEVTSPLHSPFALHRCQHSCLFAWPHTHTRPFVRSLRTYSTLLSQVRSHVREEPSLTLVRALQAEILGLRDQLRQAHATQAHLEASLEAREAHHSLLGTASAPDLNPQDTSSTGPTARGGCANALTTADLSFPELSIMCAAEEAVWADLRAGFSADCPVCFKSPRPSGPPNDSSSAPTTETDKASDCDTGGPTPRFGAGKPNPLSTAFCTMRGFLLKRGRFNTAFKRRYCELRGGTLQYFRAAGSSIRGSIDLQKATTELRADDIVADGPFSFRLLTPHDKNYQTWSLQAASHLEMVCWLRAFARAGSLEVGMPDSVPSSRTQDAMSTSPVTAGHISLSRQSSDVTCEMPQAGCMIC
jgi:hypothetical protein